MNTWVVAERREIVNQGRTLIPGQKKQVQKIGYLKRPEIERIDEVDKYYKFIKLTHNYWTLPSNDL